MKAVAASDEITVDSVCYAVFLIAHVRARAAEVMWGDITGIVDGHATGRVAFVHEVMCQLGLAIDHDAFARQAEKVDAVIAAVEGEREPLMRQPLPVHAGTGAGAIEHADHTFLQNAGAHAAKDIVLAHTVEDDIVDAGIGKQLAKQQARWARTDDSDFGAHEILPRFLLW